MPRDSRNSGAVRNRSWHLPFGAALMLLVSSAALAAGADTPPDWWSRATVVGVTIAVVVLCVIVHYEALGFLTARLKRIQLRARPRILILIFAILFVHAAEVWIFGGAYYWLTAVHNYGELLGSHSMGFLDTVYFSAVCYSTLGLGDIIPTGDVRFLVGTESLTGFVLITWSASFTFVEMERFWRA